MTAAEKDSLQWLQYIYDTHLIPFLNLHLPGLNTDDDFLVLLKLLTSKNPDMLVKSIVAVDLIAQNRPQNFAFLTTNSTTTTSTTTTTTSTTSGGRHSSPLTKIFDGLLNPANEDHRQQKLKTTVDGYKESYNRIDLSKAFPVIFDILRYSTLPCFDKKGITSERDGEKSILKFCSWKSVPIACSSIFTAFPTDNGMCCSFNMKKAEDIFLSENYYKLLKKTSRDEQSFSFESSTKDDWFTENGEPWSQLGANKGI
jgi:hypothetical protein